MIGVTIDGCLCSPVNLSGPVAPLALVVNHVRTGPHPCSVLGVRLKVLLLHGVRCAVSVNMMCSYLKDMKQTEQRGHS